MSEIYDSVDEEHGAAFIDICIVADWLLLLFLGVI